MIMVRTNHILVNDDLHIRLKIEAAKRKMLIADYVQEILQKHVDGLDNNGSKHAK